MIGTYVCAVCDRRLGYAGRGPHAGPDGPVCPTCAAEWDHDDDGDLTLPDA
jgi:hypothetical protein